MNALLDCKVSTDDLDVEFEVLPSYVQNNSSVDTQKTEIRNGLNSVEERLAVNAAHLAELNQDIDRLTNHADGIDYMVAVGSGLLAGLVDSLWVGEFSFQRGKSWSDEKVNNFVQDVAKKQGFDQDKYQGDNKLKGAVKYLEDKYHIPSDGIWNSGNYGMNGISHHLDDFAHHPSIVGLFFSILTQFTETGYFSNKSGESIKIAAPVSLVRKKNGKEEIIMLIGNDIPSKLYCGVVNWFFHLVSDMAGSSKTIEKGGIGMGIPGPIMTLLKEFSALPGVNKTALPQKIGEFFENNKFDLRSELAVGHELARQAVPVVINEVIVRAFYFIRRLVIEIKEKKSFSKIEWKNTLPFKNRTIVRMLTIATSTFTLVDLADAAIRGAIKSGANPALFAKEFILRVNFVGVGRFAVAVGTDVAMGVKRSKLRNERMELNSEQLQLMNAKMFYLQADNWVTAETTAKTIAEAEMTMEQTIIIFATAVAEINDRLDNVGNLIDDIRENDQAFIDEMKDTLMWG